ncbi:MAG: RagB/SusD family nutrient uptake outer membrane protein [Tenuifilum sp.]|uniref:RagB/SusD family nutrient uptake outer membrane protein n=1 Tax=Tenuifilum sp. TaxID=2760880 RepID=UPI0030B3E354
MKKILFVLLGVLLLSSCEDFLVQEPKLTQSTEITLSTFEGLDKAVAGAYSPLASTTWYGPGFVFDAELRSGNGKRPTQSEYTSGRYTIPYELNYNKNATSGLWGFAYYVISAVNNVLENADSKVGVNGVTQQQVNNIKAECLFLRALSHFDLVRLYAQPYTYDKESLGVPYIFKTDPAGKPARDKVGVVFDNIVKDLLDAEALMADNYKRSGTDPYAYATKPAIQALLSRVYLYMGKWQEAADYATKVINNSNYKLWTKTEYKQVWGQDVPSKGEVIFEIYGDKANSYDGYWEGPAYMTNPDGYADVAASNDLVNLYEAGDVRGELFKGVSDVPNLFWTLKYPGKGKATPDLNNVIVIRLSEMYLNRAEAIVHGATVAGTTALDDVNAVVANRGATLYTGVTENDIFIERRKELAFEGHLWFDYARTGRGMTRTDYTGTNLNNKDIPFPDYRWALPISASEIDVNPNLVQNPGY